jgi:NitT/TauT family transport system substrate-binding protein
MRAARFLTLASFAVLTLSCKKSGESNGGEQQRALRLGFFPNLTHGQALVGNHGGDFARALGKPVDVKQFNAGPAAMEALLAGELDMTYVGPSPAITAFVRSKGALRVVAGAASGGAVLVVKTAQRPEDLKGKRVAAPQLGNTQDVALRLWLKSQNLAIVDQPGDGGVAVTAVANPEILNLFKRGELEGAFVPEPWGARMIAEGGGKILLDERTLWEGGLFPTTVLVATQKALETRREDVKAILKAHLALTDRWKKDPEAFSKQVNDAFEKISGKRMPDEVVKDAFSRLDPTTDPLETQLGINAKHAHELGYLPTEEVTGIVDRSLLNELQPTAQ